MRATMKPIMNGDKNGEMMKPMVHKLSYWTGVENEYSFTIFKPRTDTCLSSLEVEWE